MKRLSGSSPDFLDSCCGFSSTNYSVVSHEQSSDREVKEKANFSMTSKIQQGGRNASLRGRKLSQGASTPALNLASGQNSTKILNRSSRSEAVDKQSSTRVSPEKAQNVRKRARRVTCTVSFLNSAQRGVSEFAGERRHKAKGTKPKEKPVSPEVLDLAKEDVVKGLLSRLYDSLGIEAETEEDVCETRDKTPKVDTTKSAAVAQGRDCGSTLSRRSLSLPQLNYPNMPCEVFYSQPVSFQTLRPFSRAKPGASSPGIGPVNNVSQDRPGSFSCPFFPAVTTDYTKSFDCASSIPTIERESSFVQSRLRSTRTLFSRKPRASRYSVTFA